MLVADLLVAPVVRVPPDTTLGIAAQVLADGGGVVLVDCEPLGELTEHDVVVALAHGATADTPVTEVMHREPMFVTRDERVDRVAAFMIATGRRTLVVATSDGPVGVICLRDAASALWGGTSLLGAFRHALQVEEERI